MTPDGGNITEATATPWQSILDRPGLNLVGSRSKPNSSCAVLESHMTLDDLRELAARLPAGSSVTLPRDALSEAVGEPSRSQPSAGLTVAELATRFHRATSTVRAWVEAGRFKDAYKLEGRDWRIPECSVTAFIAAQERGPTRLSSIPANQPSISDWRNVRRPRMPP